MTPGRAQYLQIKNQHPDAILFYQVGDFYELYDDDAEIGARELEIALTARSNGDEPRIPMAGVPIHAADGYISRLVGKGYRVAVCQQVDQAAQEGKSSSRLGMTTNKNSSFSVHTSEQVSDPALSKGLVEREVVRIVTPGTVIDPAMLAAKRNNFLAAVIPGRNAVGIAYIDITTGEFAVTQFATAEPELALQQEIARVSPAEVLVEAHYSRLGSRKKRWLATVMSEKQVTKVGSNGNANATIPEVADDEDEEDDYAPVAKLLSGLAGHVTPHDSRYFAEDDARHRLLKQFDVSSLEGFGCAHLPLAIRAAGAVLSYVQETQKGLLQHLTSLETYSTNTFMTLDPYTRRNLELFETGRMNSVKGSLLWVLDKTRSPMGGRQLRRWIGQPLLDLPTLELRQQTISELLNDTLLQARLGESLKRAGDLERLINRVRQRIANPRDLVALATGLHAASEIRDCLDETASSSAPSLTRLLARLADNDDIIELIEKALVEEPPVSINEGRIIRPGFSTELDKLKEASQNGRQWITDLEQRERKRSGISNLRVGFNKASGYFIEISNANLNRVPQEYIRRQTLTNSERYITPDLKEYETLVLNAQDRINKMENEFFVQLRSDIAIHASERILDTAHALAEIDVFLSLAEVAGRNNYCRPQLNEGDRIHIVAGRHPVVEQTQADTPFVPNDTDISNQEAQIAIITGPNMAGKSTYLRQVALITLMAQIGSYVPAEVASIGIVDRIFTRIGAQDDLATGQSTFMVEMVETANILHHSTPRSLLILDEIGRGTSTYDGLAIARAIVEYLHNNKRCGAKTFFATHYHELVEVTKLLPRVRCLNVAVTEEEGKVIFLRKIVPGGADRSYGIHVAQLAGIPRPVIHRAEEILAELERQGDAKARRKAMRDMTMPAAWQMTLLASETHPLIEDLKQMSIDELTPIEAISKLYELQQKALREP
ncbi:DNA mismatch repair protein MutS [Ktedonospora formicarum]|uniref:DNA mismatch repair protein MutS n=1 Tax=Ktedonospora formicarum TaxID=2778364 RepID=A0A8J3I2Q0_9CHLR|nr:DNA mismatch repair protein MutS [Ktedonospora formicarum]GHO45142.1 DNA mismatch repair protein MutS [Ktedonospora formicarum]